jgi:deoxyadenosine/deoxycytidine kinase
MKNTLVVNLLGGPGVGKSTLTAAIFAKLKDLDVDCEMASEFAKELVWEQRNETFKDELYIFAKQAHRLFRLNGKVDVVITDRPLILTCFYAQKDKALSKFCLDRFEQYNNMNYLLVREKAYNTNGRNQTEDEARSIDRETRYMLESYDIPYKELPGNMETADIIVKEVLEMLKEIK